MASPLVWGTDLWKTCHRLSLAYPEMPTQKQKQAARSFFSSLGSLLPCPGCRRHYDSYFKQTFRNGSVASREALVKWVYDLHEEVNRRLGKPVGAVKIEDLQRLYNAFPRRYISANGKQLLRTPRYSTIGDDIGFEDKFDETNVAEETATTSVEENERPATPPPSTVKQTAPSLLPQALRNQLEAAEHASATDVLADIDDSSSSSTLWIVLGVIALLALIVIVALIACIVVNINKQHASDSPINETPTRIKQKV